MLDSDNEETIMREPDDETVKRLASILINICKEYPELKADSLTVEGKAKTNDVKLYMPKDIERIFHMSQKQTNLLIHSNGFPVVQINRRLFVEDTALRKWLKTYEGKQFLISD